MPEPEPEPDEPEPDEPEPEEPEPDEPEPDEPEPEPEELESSPVIWAGTSWTLPTILGSMTICDREHSIMLPSVRLRETLMVTFCRPWGPPGWTSIDHW